MLCSLGVMCPEKCGPHGGGLWRYIPQVKPFYAAPYGVDTYVYMDFFADEPQAVSFPNEKDQAAVQRESAEAWPDAGDCLTASGTAGYAVFRRDGPRQKG